MLVVTAQAESTATGRRRWACRCDCGNERIVLGSNLKCGMTVSCGYKRYKNLEGQKLANLGSFISKEGAIKARKKREEEIFAPFLESLERNKNTTAFVGAVKSHLTRKKMTQRDLAAKSGLSESMAARMFKNLKGRGDAFDLIERMVYKVALGLNLGKQGYLALMEIAFPEMFEALGCCHTYTHLIDTLNDNGKPPL